MPFHRVNENGQKLWEGVVKGVTDKSLNLSLYMNKYVYVDAVKESPTGAKVFAVEVLKAIENLDAMLRNLGNLEQEISRDRRCREVDSNVKRIGELAQRGEFWKAHNELERIKNRCRQVRRQIDRLGFPSGEGAPKIKIGAKVVKEYSKYLRTYRELAENSFELKTKTRLVVGLGAGGTYETGIALMRNYGVPYIPGTALKGIAKHYAVEKLADRYGTRVFSVLGRKSTSSDTGEKPDIFEAMGAIMSALEEESDGERGMPPEEFLGWEISVNSEPLTVSELREIFGTKDKEGSVVFLDALPLPESFRDWELLEWDIMNPHYGPYYQSGEPPGDWYNPTPIKFLVVKPDVWFLFGLRKSKTCTGNCKGLLKKAEALLREALKNHGVGAKTSLGYGRFEENPGSDRN